MAEGVNDENVVNEQVAAPPPDASPAAPEAPAEVQAAPAEPESSPPPAEEPPVVHKHFTAPALLPLDRIADDGTFRVRGDDGDVAALATDLARLGQLFPIDVRLLPPDRFQVITGFRRVAALRFLHREKVLARLHTDLSDADATLLALADAIHAKTVGAEVLRAFREVLEAQGRLTPAVRDMVDKALDPDSGLAPEHAEEEVDADELAADVTTRLGAINQDLSLLADVFSELEPDRREELIRQLRYSADLVAFLESK